MASLGSFRSTVRRLRPAVMAELIHPVRLDYLRAERGRRPRMARVLWAASIPVVLMWITLVVGANVFVPQLETAIDNHAKSFLPDSASSVQALEKMGDVQLREFSRFSAQQASAYADAQTLMVQDRWSGGVVMRDGGVPSPLRALRGRR